MVAEGVVPNTTTYNALLAVHAAARSTEGAEAATMTLEALEAHPTLQPDRVSYETAISAFAIPDWCVAASSCSKSAVSGSFRRYASWIGIGSEPCALANRTSGVAGASGGKRRCKCRSACGCETSHRWCAR